MMHIAYPLYFHKIYKFPLSYFRKFINFPLFLSNVRLFCLICVFFFPYFDLDAFMPQALHSLDAPVWRTFFICRGLGVSLLFSILIVTNMRFTRAENGLYLA